MSLPSLDLSLADNPDQRGLLLDQLRDALFNIGFLYVNNHGVSDDIITSLSSRIPPLFDLPDEKKLAISKLNSPHFLGYSGFAEERTQGSPDLREQFDFGTELPVIYDSNSKSTSNPCGRDFSKLYWRLRGPNQWPREEDVPGFKKALLDYQEALSSLSYRFVHLVEEAFSIPVGTFDRFFRNPTTSSSSSPSKPQSLASHPKPTSSPNPTFLPPQHRLKLLKYHPIPPSSQLPGQGVGPHTDSSGWLTFLHQTPPEAGLEVLSPQTSTWLPAPPIEGTFVVNFGNAFEAATSGAVRATTHRVVAPRERERYSVPCFMGLPLDLGVGHVRGMMPRGLGGMREREGNGDGEEGRGKEGREKGGEGPLDGRWDVLGESVLRKWMRSHRDVGEKWYGRDVVGYYTQ